MRRSRKALMIAVVGSLTVHFAFVIYSHFFYLRGIGGVIDDTRKIFRVKSIDKKEKTLSVRGEDRAPKETPVELARDKDDDIDISPELDITEKAYPEAALERKQKIEKEINERLLTEKRDSLDAAKVALSEAESEAKETAPEARSLNERPISVSDSSLALPAARPLERPVMDEDALMRSVGDDGDKSSRDVYQPGDRELLSALGETRIGDYDDISRYLDIQLTTYRSEEGEGYFKMAIGVKKGSPLKVLPKEIMFLIDSSKSMTEQKLAPVRQGVLKAIDGMNPGDRFNVIAFSDDVMMFSQESVPFSPENVRDAQNFVRKLEAVGQTDVAGALLDISEKSVNTYPSYVILITDGRPTTGITDSRQIIQDITRNNNNERPIFTFGGGFKVNKYLLEFISYQNRGWSHFTPGAESMSKSFVSFFSEIKDPVLLNVRYRFAGLKLPEAYPRALPDFYKGSRFTVYGRFDKEDIFSMQLLGDIEDSTKELLFKTSMKEAFKGGPEIAREWAFRKIYYLISRITMGGRNEEELRARIKEISAKYGIGTPYDLED
ncbi:MAG: VWA domain-containing protein [Candidatus Omnitrophica bacterium]|nr:VWA domain-containing protein [Candidatus Omnitrophota bacterium]